MPKFTNAEKAKEAKREIGQRKRVYQRLVENRQMSPADMQRKIEIMEEIASEYDALDMKDRPELF